MPEYKEPRREPMIMPLVEQVERVLGNLKPSPGWFLGPEDLEREHNPQPDGSSGGSGRMGGDDSFNKVPFDSKHGPRSHGPLAGYRSFRYFDSSKPEYKLIPGRSIPHTANIWGVMIPQAVCDNQARELCFNRTGKWPSTLSATDTKEARNVLYQYFLVHFVVDRACDILEHVLKAATGRSYDLFLSDVLVPGRTRAPKTMATLGALSRHRRYHHAKSRGNAHHKQLGRHTAGPALPNGTIGATYAQLLSNLLSLAVRSIVSAPDDDVDRILGLNFLIGAEIPGMTKPDLVYKFSSSGPVVELPVHVW